MYIPSIMVQPGEKETPVTPEVEFVNQCGTPKPTLVKVTGQVDMDQHARAL